RIAGVGRVTVSLRRSQVLTPALYRGPRAVGRSRVPGVGTRSVVGTTRVPEAIGGARETPTLQTAGGRAPREAMTPPPRAPLRCSTSETIAPRLRPRRRWTAFSPDATFPRPG